MKRLLCIVGSMDAGGAETFLMKIYRTLDKTKYQMDFCVGKKEKGFYDDEIKKMGGKIYKITPKTKGAWKNFNDIKKIVKENKYENVLRTSQNSLSALELLAARMGGAKNLIFRSSNSSVYGGRKERIVHYLFRPFANVISNKKIAPSKEAGDFMFGWAEYVIVNNGLNIEDYEFSEGARKKYRKEFGAKENTVVIGHVGRFNKQKNHKFLIDVFEEYHKKNEDSVLWLLGEGELKDEIKKYVNSKGLKDCVKFLGVREDVNKIYSAMDCFVFPSLFEGMPNTVIEAQVAGLSCVVADTVTRDCGVSNQVVFLKLEDDVGVWAESIILKNVSKRKSYRAENKDTSYDIVKVTETLTPVLYNDKEHRF